MTRTYLCALYDRFSAQVALAPGALALRYPDGRTLTRAQLAALAEKQAFRLFDQGIRRGDVVAMFHDKEPAGYALMLACLRLGAACVNLDDKNPAARIAAILATCQSAAIFGPATLAQTAREACQAWGREIFLLADDQAEPRVKPPESDVIGTDIAYIMFTSGSTGVPKGVAISHAQVSNLIDWAAEEFGIGSADTLANANPMYFDNSVFDFYAALFNGATLAPLGAEVVQNPLALVNAVEKAECTLWFSVPSLLIYLVTTRVLTAERWPNVRCLAFGGEGYPVPELRKLFACFGQRARLVNVYGPTECTCICSAHEIGEPDLADSLSLPPIGRLARNFRGFLLEENIPVAPGEAGELCLAGPNVGLGYYREPGKTAEAFVPNPICETHHERMYRTGDMMRIDPETGLLHFVGRRDHQFKHMGYRIEPGEIEAALNRIDGIERSLVVYKRRRPSFGEIVGFVATGNAAMNEESIKEALRTQIPAYMIPSRIVLRKSLPANANGKIDRNKLLEEA